MDQVIINTIHPAVILIYVLAIASLYRFLCHSSAIKCSACRKRGGFPLRGGKNSPILIPRQIPQVSTDLTASVHALDFMLTYLQLLHGIQQ